MTSGFRSWLTATSSFSLLLTLCALVYRIFIVWLCSSEAPLPPTPSPSLLPCCVSGSRRLLCPGPYPRDLLSSLSSLRSPSLSLPSGTRCCLCPAPSPHNFAFSSSLHSLLVLSPGLLSGGWRFLLTRCLLSLALSLSFFLLSFPPPSISSFLTRRLPSVLLCSSSPLSPVASFPPASASSFDPVRC